MQNDNFLELLLNDTDNAEQLLKLLEAELVALKNRQFSELESILSEKLPLLALLGQNGKVRNQTLTSLNYSADKQGLLAFAAQSSNGAEIVSALDNLNVLLESCQTANLRNGRLIKANQNTGNSLLNILRGTDVPNLYDNRGSAAKISQRRPLSQA